MADQTPFDLAALLAADASSAREQAWERFVAAHSRLLYHAARSLGGDHDATMDRYAAILEALRAEDCRRLRGFVPDGRTRFTTWLLVVARRLAVDHHRTRYGRASDDPGTPVADATIVRRRLADLLVEPLGEDDVPAPEADAPDRPVREQQRRAALLAALADLSPQDRLLLALRFIHDVPVRDIARRMGFPTPFHVYRRVDTLRGELRRRLADLGVEDAAP